ncbi:hypothetical protein D9758_000481 [Tetrapyrgos nigripes]|uniref:Nuclear protein localization protein 4 n=1 Tax=Tetrapyrgos nigripes TaxID=182062 RepID=A0A8H5LZA9_9AGAR|nr:hypothetical protein D9758_000481 [Tetrapyrgos nigripes]
MLIRVRSKDGNFRFELSPDADVMQLFQKILETTSDADEQSFTISNQPRGNEAQLLSLKGRSIQSLGLNHGDLVFVQYKSKESDTSTTSQSTSNAPATSSLVGNSTIRPWETVNEDAVDTFWRSQDGKIARQRDLQFCKHGPKGMCDYCMSLEPYDAVHHAKNGIKHLSYHAYLRKLTPKTSSDAAAALPPLNPLDYRVKAPCPTGNHPAWPAGICTGCQPSAITLQSQPFRMVDHLEIASQDIIERFLQAWRRTGLQRFGWLIGHYEPYDKVPMGIKAVVEAIHEPPQEGELDGLTLGLPWEDEPRIRALAGQSSPPLTIVGYIFTDLDPSEEDRTKNVYKRHPQSFLMSSLEAIFAATMQRANPTSSKSSPTGQFSSRLVTAILTATEDGLVDVTAYQVSEQASAMVEADMIEASVDPTIVRVKEEDRSAESARYVPDVFFSYKNEYGLEVKKSAKPAFPVEYLMVNVTHGFPQNPSPIFQSIQFSIENRPGLEDQTIETVLSQLSSLGAPDIVESKRSQPGEAYKTLELAKWLSDWHLIAFLGTTQLFSPDDMKVLIRTVSSPTLLEDSSQLDPLLATEGWQTLMTFTRESAPRSAPAQSNTMDDSIPQDILDQIAAEEAASQGTTPAVKTCPHCTFENDASRSDCDKTGLFAWARHFKKLWRKKYLYRSAEVCLSDPAELTNAPPRVPLSDWKQYAYYSHPRVNNVEVCNLSPGPNLSVPLDLEEMFEYLRSPGGTSYPDRWIRGQKHSALPPKPQRWKKPDHRKELPFPKECTLNPFLVQSTLNPGFTAVYWHVRDPLSSICLNLQDVVLPLNQADLAQPATYPFLTHMYISGFAFSADWSKEYSLPWPIVIENKEGILCDDVFHGIRENFHEFVRNSEYEQWLPETKEWALKAYAVRPKWTRDDIFLRRSDYLAANTMFRGLKPNLPSNQGWVLLLGPDNSFPL